MLARLSRLSLYLLLAVLGCSAVRAQTQAWYTEPMAEVKEFHGAGISMSSYPSPYYKLFQAETRKGEAAIPTLERVLHEGTPAAQFYAALALYSIDTERGTVALESLVGDTREVSCLIDCSRWTDTVGRLASSALKGYRGGAKDFFHALGPDDNPKDYLWR